ncbi:MAG: M90 family metallopeptidase [bacterium]
MIFEWLRNRRRRALLEGPVDPSWIGYIERNVALWGWLDDGERRHLLDITRVIVAEKDWEGGGGLLMTPEIEVTVAAQAALLLLGLKHDYYRNVDSIIVYPAGYRLPRGRVGMSFLEAEHVPVLGHASPYGPVVLSWRSTLSGGRNATDGRNLVFHEFAHKLDMKDGVVDGTPPLLKRVSGPRWFKVMTKEYRRLQQQAKTGREKVLDLYGATNVAEFFAVATEAFFEESVRLEADHPDLYGVLRDYFGQDTAARLSRRRRQSS